MRVSACDHLAVAAAKPTRQPAMEWLLESEPNSMATSSRTGHLQDARRACSRRSRSRRRRSRGSPSGRARARSPRCARRRPDPPPVVVGLWGNERISILGFGQVRSMACSRFSKKSESGVSGTWRRSPPAMITEYWWIGYVGSGHRTTSPGPIGHQHEMGQSLFGADHRHALAVGIHAHAAVALVPLGDPAAQVGQPARSRVAVIARVARRVADLVDHVIGRGQVRIAHAQIDHVLTGAPRGVLEGVDLRKHVGRKPVDLVEMVLKRGHDPCSGRTQGPKIIEEIPPAQTASAQTAPRAEPSQSAACALRAAVQDRAGPKPAMGPALGGGQGGRRTHGMAIGEIEPPRTRRRCLLLSAHPGEDRHGVRPPRAPGARRFPTACRARVRSTPRIDVSTPVLPVPGLSAMCAARCGDAAQRDGLGHPRTHRAAVRAHARASVRPAGSRQHPGLLASRERPVAKDEDEGRRG